MLRVGVYLHFPYCLQICPYCDFAVRKERVIPQRRFTDAIIAELRRRAPAFAEGREVVSIYLGGGTPSLWEPDELARAVNEVRSLFRLAEQVEITLEANPEVADLARLTAYRAAGVNRVSLGVQSFDSNQLKALGRLHTAELAEQSVAAARAAGCLSISVDLIHGGEGQTPEAAGADAAKAASLGVDHVSCYALTLTALAYEVPMARAVRRGQLKLPGDDAQEAMGESIRAALGAAGLQRYEISNFAKPGFESVHNGLYWSGVEYVAAGPGAAGFHLDRSQGGLRGTRYTNDRSVPKWMDGVLGREQGPERAAGKSLPLAAPPGLVEAQREELPLDDLIRERLFTGLRRVAGVDLAEVEEWSGRPVRAPFAEVIDRLVREGLAAVEGARLRLTERGLDLHSEAALRFF